MIRFRLRFPSASFRLRCTTTPDPEPIREPLTAICFALGGGVAMAAVTHWLMGLI